MNERVLYLIITSLAFGGVVLAAKPDTATAGGSSTNPSPAVAPATVTQPTPPPAPGSAEPTEKEMREAVQHHIDEILSAQPRPAPPASSGTQPQPPVVYGPYGVYPRYGYYYYHRDSKESQYANWTDVAHSANQFAHVEIVSFKKIRCTTTPGQEGAVGEYVAQLSVRGNNPIAQEIMQTSGRVMQANFFKGDNGWILSPTK